MTDLAAPVAVTSPSAATDEPIDAARALAEEIAQVYGETLDERQPAKDLNDVHAFIHGLADDAKPLGLAFSGGGIRSATFNLGVLQGLAQSGWLPKFHFLSTVSGGGYIGSWLSAWIARTSFTTVNKELQRTTVRSGAPKSPEPDPIRHLRGYSNYLSPVWGLSLDAMTLIATYVRNVLINWLVLLPLFAAFVVWPMLNHAVVGALSHAAAIDGRSLVAALVFVVIASAIPIAYTASDLPGPEGFRPRVNDFYLYFVTPLTTAAISASWLWAAAATRFDEASSHGKYLWVWFAASGACIHIIGVIAGVAWRKLRGSPRTRTRPVLHRVCDAIIVVTAGALGGCLCYLGITQFATHGWLVANTKHELGYATLAVPFLLGAFALSTTGFTALTRRTRTESDREWWARAGGFLIILTALWLGLHAVALYISDLAKSLMGQHWVAAPTAGVGIGLFGAAMGYWSNGKRIAKEIVHWTKKLGSHALDAVCGAFIVAMFVGLSMFMRMVIGAMTSGAAANSGAVQAAHAWMVALLCLLACVGVALFFAYVIGVNAFSMHAMYGNRLVRAYLGASNAKREPHPFTGFDPSDNLKMCALSGGRQLFHIVNLAINIVRPSADNLQWQERKAAVFTITRLHSGSPTLGYRPSDQYGKSISLGRALTISGAAASPSMGYHSSPLVAFVMTIFNVRLGWWLPNPKSKRWRSEEPRFGFGSLLSEALSGATADKDFVYLSDGGHFENLALYELVRRRCHGIVVVDAGADPEYSFDDLQSAIRKIRVDLGIPIEFEENALPTPQRAKETGCHFAVGKIRYSVVDEKGVDGSLLYIKPVLSGDESLDVDGYAKMNAVANKQFPQQPTSDQFFDESQFESYRWLGYHSVTDGRFPAAGAPVKLWGTPSRPKAVADPTSLAKVG